MYGEGKARQECHRLQPEGAPVGRCTSGRTHAHARTYAAGWLAGWLAPGSGTNAAGTFLIRTASFPSLLPELNLESYCALNLGNVTVLDGGLLVSAQMLNWSGVLRFGGCHLR